MFQYISSVISYLYLAIIDKYGYLFIWYDTIVCFDIFILTLKVILLIYIFIKVRAALPRKRLDYISQLG
jgi:NADH:ubiquinone oxidoreductase subunit H